MENERQLLDKGKLSAIGKVDELVKEGRVPIKLQTAEVGDFTRDNAERVVFYNIPPDGFTLGKNGCTGQVDTVECSVEYFDGSGKSLGKGKLIAVRIEDTIALDQEISKARKEFGY